jgi:hypothetical protein
MNGLGRIGYSHIKKLDYLTPYMKMYKNFKIIPAIIIVV